MKIVAFGYKSRVGKDTASKMLVQKARLSGKFANVQRVPFARKLKQVAHDLFGVYGLREGDFYEEEKNHYLRDVKLPVCDKTPVELWIAVGDGLRRGCCESLWIDYVLGTKCDLLVISDLRYPNEFIKIKELGGITVKVNRKESVEKGSDKYLDILPEGYKWDVEVDNNSSLGYLDKQVEEIFQLISGGQS